MFELTSERERAPQIALTQVSAKRNQALECWSIGWEIENQGADSLSILSARLPHGQFKSDELLFEPALALASGKKTKFTVPVRCNQPPGLVTENAFVIFQMNWRGEPSRIFVRIRVVVTDDGRPQAETESISTQKVGFSGVAS